MDEHERRQRVAEVYLRGITDIDAIAAKVKIPRETAALDVATLRADWVVRSFRTVDEYRAEELRRIEWVEREAIEAWERSKLPEEESQVERVAEPVQTPDGPNSVGGVVRTKSSKRVRGRDGDKRWLDVLRDARRDRSLLLGLYAQTREPTGPTVEATTDDDAYAAMPFDELESLARSVLALGAGDPCGVPPAEEPGGSGEDGGGAGGGPTAVADVVP